MSVSILCVHQCLSHSVLTLVDVSKTRRSGVRGDGRVVGRCVLGGSEGHGCQFTLALVGVLVVVMLTVRSEPATSSLWAGTWWRTTAAARSFAAR